MTAIQQDMTEKTVSSNLNESSTTTAEVINLGFPYFEFSPSEVLRSNLPSKIGGKPAWINPHKLPTDLKCRKCGACLIFLLQIYAPRIKVLNAHRMIYLFACWICGEDVKAYRSIVQDDSLLADHFNLEISSQCCHHCLLPAELRTVPVTITESNATNLTTSSSGREHQRCLNGLKYGSNGTAQGMLAESVLEIECEAEIDKDLSKDGMDMPCIDEKELLSKLPLMDENDEEDDNEGELGPAGSAAVSGGQDLCLESYISYMTKYSGHVIRYGGSEPVWFSDKEQISENDVPICERCGSVRRFEFQVQSTLLDAAGYNVGANLELAFGILCVYTCEKDCCFSDGASTYSEEFVYKQKDKTLTERRRV